MRVVITGGAGFIGRAVVDRLHARGDEVVALVRDPARAAHLEREGVTLVRSALDEIDTARHASRGADAVIHAAGDYRVGIPTAERPGMWDANVGTAERVLDAAIAEDVPRIVYLSTVGVFGDTKGQVVDETYRRDPRDGFLSWYDETKLRAHEAAEARIVAGAPIVIAMPAQVYGPHDHSSASEQLHRAYHGTLRYVALTDVGVGWVHVHDLADGIVAALDRGRVGESYVLGGPNSRLRDALALAAHLGGSRTPLIRVPTSLIRLVTPLNDALGGLPGMPANLRETIAAGTGVTYWASHDKATREIGFAPRDLEQGILDTWGHD
jgi:nucleoside-diphosphate-sugar epimerase